VPIHKFCVPMHLFLPRFVIKKVVLLYQSMAFTQMCSNICLIIYGDVVPPVQFALDYGKQLIDAANRCELVEMKMAAENILVSQ
jgi:hypothetical protein